MFQLLSWGEQLPDLCARDEETNTLYIFLKQLSFQLKKRTNQAEHFVPIIMFAHILPLSLGKQKRNLHKSISPILREKLANREKQTSKQTIETKTNKQI